MLTIPSFSCSDRLLMFCNSFYIILIKTFCLMILSPHCNFDCHPGRSHCKLIQTVTLPSAGMIIIIASHCICDFCHSLRPRKLKLYRFQFFFK